MIGSAIGAVAEDVRDGQRLPLVGRDRRIISEQRHRHGGGMRRHAGAEIERHAIEMIAGA